MNDLERLIAEGMSVEDAREKLGWADLKQLEDRDGMSQASRLYRPTERDPRNPWQRNHKPVLGTIRGRNERRDSKDN